VRIRALSVFERVIYHSVVVDPTDPRRPRLEVEARVQPDDVEGGPLLLPLAEFRAMVGDEDLAAEAVAELRRGGRLADHLGVPHVAFPFWEPVVLER
jgi:hypothetical protein